MYDHRFITTRAGFTLVEIMVSLMIFVVVSGAMVAIMMMSSELFRRGEFSRSANDETIAVLGAVNDDLSHLVPESGDGWFYAGVPSKSGNTMVAFTTTGQQINGLGSRGQNARTLVSFWVEETGPQPRLRRVTLDDTLDIKDFIGSLLTNNGIQDQMVTGFETLTAGYYTADGNGPNTLVSVSAASLPEQKNWFGRRVMRALANNHQAADLHFSGTYNWVSPTGNNSGGSQELLDVTIPSSVLTEGCLHFSAWLALTDFATMHRPTDSNGRPDWEQVDRNGNTRLGPWGGSITGEASNTEAYDTRPQNWRPNQPNALTIIRKPPFPSAVRLAFVLTGGGRFAPQGILQSDLTTDISAGSFRIAGLQGLPSIPGSMIRIGDEWIAYNSVSGSTIGYGNLDPVLGPGRGARRSAVTAHSRGEKVRIGQTYSLVRALPR